MGERYYEQPIFANHFYLFQMDIIDQTKRSKDIVPVTFLDFEGDPENSEGKHI
jgi:hypothetical protein